MTTRVLAATSMGTLAIVFQWFPVGRTAILAEPRPMDGAERHLRPWRLAKWFLLSGIDTSGRLETSARGLGFSLNRSCAGPFNEQLPPFAHSPAMSLSPAELKLVIDVGNDL